MKLRLNKFFVSTWFWAIIPSFIIYFFIADVGRRYSVTVENKEIGQFDRIAFSDLNGDGITEMIHAKLGPPLNTVLVMDNEGNYFDQWNLPDNLTSDISNLYFGNHDQDLFAEIYVFTTHLDSIFLNVNEFFEPEGLHLERVFIATVNLVEGDINSNIKHFGFFDQNKDGKREFYFRINTGFGLWPRLCYFYDLAQQKLKTSPFTGINFNDPILKDIDGDACPEIFSSMTAAGNYETPTPFTDYSAWLMVLTDQFEFKFPPIGFPGFGGSLDVYNIGDRLVVVYNYKGVGTPVRTPGIMFYSVDGKLIKEVSFSELELPGRVQSAVLHTKKQDRIVLMGSSMFILSEQLEIIEKRKIPLQQDYYLYRYDLDYDEQKELFLYSKDDKKMIIYNSDLEEYGTIPFNVPDYEWQVSHKVNKDGETKLFIKSGNSAHFLQLKDNPYYWAGYLAYPSIYLAFVLFIGLIKNINATQIEKRENQKRKLQTLQLQAIKGQLDPHFTFNALNTVAALLYLDDRKAAYDHLIKFTRLLRQMLNDAERVYRPVEEELEFVKVYLELEKLRFGDKFHFTIDIGEGVTLKEQVPVLSIQTFVENAIKHGLMHKGAGGLLKISIQRENQDLKLTIEDNGIGRAKAANLSNSTGIGLKLNSEFYDILNQMNTRPIRHKITDLFDVADLPAGTRAEVWVPMEL
ncbi:MAG: histidine kinase [Bacteroidota bacterium]